MRHTVMSTNPAEGTTQLAGVCIVTGKRWTLSVDSAQYFAFMQGAHAQDAFPTLTADQRELLISGTTAEGWDQLFGSDED